MRFACTIGILGTSLFGMPACTMLVNRIDPSHAAELLHDTIAPDPVTAFTLYSSRTRNESSTVSYTPDITVTHSGSDDVGGSGFSHFEVQVVNALDSSVVHSWTSVGADTSFRLANLSLVDGNEYKAQVRAVDLAGNASAFFEPAASWTVVEVETEPFAGQGLAATATLGDLDLAASFLTLDASRSIPVEGKVLTVEGPIGWDPAGLSSIFLRATELVLEPGAVISARGQNGGSDPIKNGGSGGSGGGAGGGGHAGIAGESGGSAGADGVSGGSGFGGEGTASIYNVGFTYGMGGDASNESTDLSGNAGIGGNGAGGGGNGTRGGSGAGGGGGGGLVVIVADEISGSGLVQADGGDGGRSNAWTSVGGHGGGGVVWVAAKSYSANITPRTLGGGAGMFVAMTEGYPGESRIFQLNDDGSLTERLFSEYWSDDGVASEITKSLPIMTSNLPWPSTLADDTLAGPLDFDSATYNLIHPFSAKTLDVSGTISIAYGTPSSVAIYASDIEFSGATIDVSGGSSSDSSGANGASGGGAGTNSTGINAGDGGSGRSGNLSFDYRLPGLGLCRFFGLDFDVGLGGSGGQGADNVLVGGLGGAGVNGCGGGGGGGIRSGAGGGGGGGGGGLIVLVADSITGNASLLANGGNGFDFGGGSGPGGGGGGGVIWIAAKSYDGAITPSVNGGNAGALMFSAADGTSGTAKIFQINSDDTLTQRLFTDTW